LEVVNPEVIRLRNYSSKLMRSLPKQYGGKVFYIFSSTVGERKEIRNKEVIAEIKQEIERLKR